MGTGQYTNFGNDDDDAFNIAMDSAGHLNFLANAHNGKGDRRMSILDDTNEVSFDGAINVAYAVTIGGPGSGALQLRAPDGDNTIFLGSSADDETNIVMGGNGRDGVFQVKNGDGNVAINMQAYAGSMILGAPGEDGNIGVLDSAGAPSISMDGESGTITLSFGSQTGMTLDGSGYVTVGRADKPGVEGTIDVCNADGEVTIKLSGDQGLIEYDRIVQDTTPDGSPTLAAHQPVQGALARVLALQAFSYRAAGADGREMPRIALNGEDVERVCPEIAVTTAEGRRGMNYSRLTALLVEAVKEQQLQLAGLQERLDRLETPAA